MEVQKYSNCSENSLEELRGRCEQSKERISKLQNTVIKIVLSEGKKEKRMRKMDRTWGTYGIPAKAPTYASGKPQKEKRGRRGNERLTRNNGQKFHKFDDTHNSKHPRSIMNLKRITKEIHTEIYYNKIFKIKESLKQQERTDSW